MPFTSVDYLPDMLVHPKMGPSYKLEETAFNLAFGTDKSCWYWITEKAPASDIRRSPSYSYARGAQCGSPTSPQAKTGEELVHRPEIQLFGRAMFGAGKVFSSPLVYDYPWNELGDATVVDVGGGIGTSIHPNQLNPTLLTGAHPSYHRGLYIAGGSGPSEIELRDSGP